MYHFVSGCRESERMRRLTVGVEEAELLGGEATGRRHGGGRRRRGGEKD